MRVFKRDAEKGPVAPEDELLDIHDMPTRVDLWGHPGPDAAETRRRALGYPAAPSPTPFRIGEAVFEWGPYQHDGQYGHVVGIADDVKGEGLVLTGLKFPPNPFLVPMSCPIALSETGTVVTVTVYGEPELGETQESASAPS